MRVSLSGSSDNQGNSFLLERLQTSRYPLGMVLKELAHQTKRRRKVTRLCIIVALQPTRTSTLGALSRDEPSRAPATLVLSGAWGRRAKWRRSPRGRGGSGARLSNCSTTNRGNSSLRDVLLSTRHPQGEGLLEPASQTSSRSMVHRASWFLSWQTLEANVLTDRSGAGLGARLERVGDEDLAELGSSELRQSSCLWRSGPVAEARWVRRVEHEE